jgi:hypothetical protein
MRRVRLGIPSNIVADVLAVSLLLMILIPTSVADVAKGIGINPHPISFFIGPALYSYGAQLVPNIDYMSQYGVGLAVVFQYFLSDSIAEAFTASVLVTLLGTAFFVATFYFLAKWTLESGGWAFFVTLIALILNFFGPFPFGAPSAWPVRYPLLPLFCLLFIVYCRASLIADEGADWRRIVIPLLLGLLAGVSVFWLTEIGLYMIAIGAFCVWHVTAGHVRAAGVALIYVGMSIATFMVLSAVAFGAGVLSVAFIKGLFTPAVVYGSGFGAWPINWLAPYEYFTNVLIPLVLVATTIWAISTSASEPPSHKDEHEKRHLLLMLSLLGLAMISKYLNMSLSAVWFSNAYYPLLVFALWLRLAIRQVAGPLGVTSRRQPLFVQVASACVLGVGAIYVWTFEDQRMNTQFGIQAYALYPSVIRQTGYPKTTMPIARPMDFALADVADQDVALIQKLVAPKQPVYIYSSRDWVYAMRAQRAPGLPFIPSSMSLLKNEAEQALSHANVVFMDTSKPLWEPDNTELREYLRHLLASEFQEEQRGVDLVAYRRLNPVSAENKQGSR